MVCATIRYASCRHASDFNHQSLFQVATVVNHANEEEKEKTDQEYEEEYDIRFEWDQHKNLISPQTFYWYVSSFLFHITLLLITFFPRNLLTNFFFFIIFSLVALPGTLLNAPIGKYICLMSYASCWPDT